MAHCQPSLKISRKSVWKFLRKVANRQTNRQLECGPMPNVMAALPNIDVAHYLHNIIYLIYDSPVAMKP